jgi:membrane protein
MSRETTRADRPQESDRLTPQPEWHEPRIEDPGLTDLSRRDRVAILIRAVKSALRDQISTAAKAVAYSLFLVIPSGLLVALGIYSMVANPSDVPRLLSHLQGVIPASAIQLLDQSLRQLTTHSSGGAMVIVGLVFALWALIGAMQTMIWALNVTYERRERRNFIRQRLAALGMVVCVLLAIAAVGALLIAGPLLSAWAGRAVGAETVVTWAWWIAEWPLLVLVLLAAFAGIYYLGPDVEYPRYRFITPGAVFAVVVWLIISGGFSFYAAHVGSYNKTWGSLAAVIVMLTWLWLSSLALLMGAEINAETERSRELRRGEPAGDQLQAPSKSQA